MIYSIIIAMAALILAGFYIHQQADTIEQRDADFNDFSNEINEMLSDTPETPRAWIEEWPEHYRVNIEKPNGYWITVKSFPKEDDPAYARLLAEELCEHIN